MRLVQRVREFSCPRWVMEFVLPFVHSSPLSLCSLCSVSLFTKWFGGRSFHGDFISSLQNPALVCSNLFFLTKKVSSSLCFVLACFAVFCRYLLRHWYNCTGFSQSKRAAFCDAVLALWIPCHVGLNLFLRYRLTADMLGSLAFLSFKRQLCRDCLVTPGWGK